MRATPVSLTALLLTASTALAQTTAQTPSPSPAPDATTGGIGDYWWLIVVVVLVALAIWYFTRGRTRL
jgi:LPXTG-motif cell wall-anchored protein